MDREIGLDDICTPSEDVVARVIEGEMIIVPLVAGIGDAEGELYALNSTGHAIWQKLDGQRTLKDVSATLSDEFDAPLANIEKDVLGFAREMTQRGILTVKAEG